MAFNLVPEYPEGTIANGCFCCRVQRRPDERLVDLNVTIDFEGFAILCETCAKEIAHLLGYTTEDISVQLAAMRHEIGTLRDENRHLKAIRDAVQKVSA